MAEQQNRPDLFASGKVDLHAVAEVFGAMHVGAPSESLEPSCEQRAHAVGGQLVIAGRFDRDQLPDRFDDLFLPGFEVTQPLVPHCTGGGLIGSRRTCSFLLSHLWVAARPAAEEASSGTSRTV